MNVVTLGTLSQFWASHPDAEMALRDWYWVVRHSEFGNFAEVKAAFPAADWVKGFIVFDIMNNQYRLVVLPNFAGKRFLVELVGTHRDYDAWTRTIR